MNGLQYMTFNEKLALAGLCTIFASFMVLYMVALIMSIRINNTPKKCNIDPKQPHKVTLQDIFNTLEDTNAQEEDLNWSLRKLSQLIADNEVPKNEFPLLGALYASHQNTNKNIVMRANSLLVKFNTKGKNEINNAVVAGLDKRERKMGSGVI